MPPLDKATAVRSEGKAHTLKTSALRMHEPNATAYKQINSINQLNIICFTNEFYQYTLHETEILPDRTMKNMMILEHFIPRMLSLV